MKTTNMSHSHLVSESDLKMDNSQENEPTETQDTGEAFCGEPPLPDVCQSVSASTSSSVCRICQLGRTETDKDLVEIGCQCKGTMARCHTECLVEWANAQQSAVCEICQTEYPGVEARTVSRTRSCSRSFRDVLLECNTRRFWFVIITVFLIFCTIVSAILLHFVENEYLQSFPPAFVHNRVVVSNFKFSFGVTLTLFIFCLVMFVVVLIVWVISECFFWPQQRMLLRVQRFQVVPTDDDDTTSFVMTNRHRTSPRTREIARRWRTTSL